MMNKTKRIIIRNIMVIFVLMVMYLAFKEPLDAKASYHLRTGISLEPAAEMRMWQVCRSVFVNIIPIKIHIF